VLDKMSNKVVSQPIKWDPFKAANFAVTPLIAAHGNSIASLVKEKKANHYFKCV